MGFVGKNTYLADTWNRLDMFIVFAGYGRVITLAIRSDHPIKTYFL
jgi:hypothetical protein